MKFVSTRNSKKYFTVFEAIHQGLAPDSGLFVPQAFPEIKVKHQKNISKFGADFLEPFFLQNLKSITKKAFNFKIPLHQLKNGPTVLELFHGPTSAFKDFAARFLAEFAIANQKTNQIKTVLVATSGDTGGAVAAAFYKKRNFRVVILFPKGKISKRQEKQLTAFGENIHAIAVKGTFDDCQRIVKRSFQDHRFRKYGLISANSINIARILPQAVYYAHTSLQVPRYDFIIPTGNLGNALACLWAKKMGYPIGKVIFACNENKSLLTFSKTAKFKPMKTVHTLANAMDVGAPSNFERLQALYPNFKNFQKEIEVFSVSDAQIKATIKSVYKKLKYIICPHTATAFFVHQRRKNKKAVIVSTAHPAKFESIVEPLIGEKIKIPKQLKKILMRKSHYQTINPSLAEFHTNLKKIK